MLEEKQSVGGWMCWVSNEGEGERCDVVPFEEDLDGVIANRRRRDGNFSWGG